MFKRNSKRLLCFVLSLIIVASSLVSNVFMSVSAATVNDLLIAAKNYVRSNGNRVTADGLLTAVQDVLPEATLNENQDFYIKHAVPGVKDDTTDYPLDIKGSDGAVAAIFGYDGNRYGFSAAFSHEVESLHIDETAIVGTSSGFTYDGSGNVTGYSGTADKIVFPAGYTGTMTNLTDKASVQNVKVVILNNTLTSQVAYRGFYDWNGLIAVQIADQAPHSFFPQWNTDDEKTSREVFAECDNLKYVKLPENAKYSGWNTLYLPSRCFNNSVRLENVNFPTINNTSNHPIGYRTYGSTALRELLFPAYATYYDENQPYNAPTYEGGTRNIHYYNDAMTFIRAAALAAAAVNELSISATEEQITSAAKNAIVGSADAEAFRNSLNYQFSNEGNKVLKQSIVTVSNGTDSIPVSLEAYKTLSNLEVKGYEISPAFHPETLEYTVSVPDNVNTLQIIPTLVSGAALESVIGNDDLTANGNKISITVNNTDSQEVVYKITVEKNDTSFNDALKAAEIYVKQKKNEVTPEGLLAAVQNVIPNVTLDSEKDFYIKHAVNGVKDNTTDYPLNIEGSDGAVSAVFENNGERYGFAAAFSHTVETIHIANTAVVGTSEGFTYDGSGNVTAYNGTADKIVFPAGYTGTMTELADKTAAQNVKVLIYNNGVAFLSKAFNNWDGLIAVQIDNGSNSFLLASAVNSKREDHMFSGCDNLKYFKFPEKVNNSYYWSSMFPNSFLENCGKLEALIMPLEVTSGSFNTYGYHTFYGTAVRDFVMPTCNKNATISDTNDVRGNSQAYGGTTNFHHYRDAMTYCRAVALAASGVNMSAALSTDKMIEKAKASITGSSDSASFIGNLGFSCKENAYDTANVKTLTVSRSNLESEIRIIFSKTLSDLTITDYELSIPFDPTVTEGYAIKVPSKVKDIQVNAIPVAGASISEITGNTELAVGGNTVSVKVKTADNKEITYSISVEREAGMDEIQENIIEAAKSYVANKKNSVTPEGLLAAVKVVAPDTTLDTEKDFYIKHAVNGVKDNTTDYPLNIEGSDGAVAAVFGHNGKRYGFSVAFAHSDEIINISETAVVGFSDGFTYDDYQNVIAYSGTADKIVFPAGYTGTMYKLSDLSAAKKVKVLIYNCGVSFVSNAFSDWDGLIAVQINNGDVSFNLGSAVNNKREENMFASCDSLKYFKFPNKISNSFYWNAMFPDSFLQSCPKLETLIMPTQATSGSYTNYGYHSFAGTAVRDIVLPSCNRDSSITDGQGVFIGSVLTDGTTNLHLYKEEMTFVRAAALSAAGINELSPDKTSADALETAKSAVKGSSNAAGYVNSLIFSADNAWEYTDYLVYGEVTVSNNLDLIPLYFNISKTLRLLDIGYDLTPAFSPGALEYTAEVGYEASNVEVITSLADGATLGEITGNTNLQTGVPQTISVPVTTFDGHIVTYKITVTRKDVIALDDTLISRVKSYANLFEGTNYTTKETYEKYLMELSKEYEVKFKMTDFYKYNSVPGAKEDTEILVPGHNGYLTAVMELYNGSERINVPVMSTIKPYMKNYTFNSNKVSKNEDFHLSDDGKTLEYYDGNAEKVVIPNGVEAISPTWMESDHPENIKVLIIPDTVSEIPGSMCYGMTYLEACYIGNNVLEIPGSMFIRCYYLQFVHLPEELETIGGTAFRFTMSLPELYIPSTVETIGNQAFWISGVRNYHLPKNITSIGNWGIAYPQFRGGIYGENDAQTPEMVSELTKIMDSYQFSKNNVTVTCFSDNLMLGAANAITCSDYQATGAVIVLRAPDSLKETVFKDKISSYNSYEWDLDMGFAEQYARAQVALDHVLVNKDSLADEIVEYIGDAIYSTYDLSLSWKSELIISDNKANGVINLACNGTSVDLILNRELYSKPQISAGSVLKGSLKGPSKDLVLDDPSEKNDTNVNDADSNNANENNGSSSPDVSFDSFEEEKDTDLKAENGDNIVYIKIKRIDESLLGKELLERLKDLPFVAFDLKAESERDVKLNGKLTVAVPLPKSFNGKLTSIYIVTDTGKLIDMGAKVNGDKMLFQTTVLSRYILVQDKTDYTPMIIAFSVAGGVLIIGLGVLIFVLIRKRKRNG